MLTRRAFMIGATAIPMVVITTMAHAQKPPVFSAGGGVAINGYDPVAYFTQSAAVQGSPDHTSTHDGAVWQFANAENKAMFDADPAKYAPQYGGYCAYAVSRGYTASTDPHAWTVHNGKLYLNYSKSVQGLWRLRRAAHIKSADANWPSVLD